MGLLTLNGKEVEVDETNYRPLALEYIEKKRTADPTLTTSMQAAILQSFMEAAKQPTYTYVKTPSGAVVKNDAANRVEANPMVRASNWIMGALPNGVASTLATSSDATVSWTDRVITATKDAANWTAEKAKDAAAAAGEAAAEANRTVLVVGVAAAIGGVGFLVWQLGIGRKK